MSEFLDWLSTESASYSVLDRLPDLARMLHTPSSPFHFRFLGKWPAALRRRRIMTVSAQVLRWAKAPASSATLTLYSLEGTAIFIEAVCFEHDHSTIIGRAFASSADDHRRGDRDVASHWQVAPCPIAAALTSGLSPYIAETATPSPRRSNSSDSVVSSSAAAFHCAYAALSMEHLNKRVVAYAVDIMGAWSRWPDLLESGRRRAVITVIDDLMPIVGGTPCTGQAAAALLDRFLERAPAGEFKPTKRSMRYMVCVSVLVACKNFEMDFPTLAELIKILRLWDPEDTITTPQVLTEVEVMFLRVLEYRLHPPTLREYVTAALNREGVEVGSVAFEYALWLCDACHRHLPSAVLPMPTVAAAIVIDALREAGLGDDETKHCANRYNIDAVELRTALEVAADARHAVLCDADCALAKRFCRLPK